MSEGAVSLDRHSDGILVISVGATLTDADVRHYLDAMAEEVAAGTPFAMVTRYLEGRPRKDALGHRLEADWMAEHRTRLRQSLVAVALVHDSGPVRRMVERVAMSGAGRRLFGCPCRPFAELEDALAWTGGMLGGPG